MILSSYLIFHNHIPIFHIHGISKDESQANFILLFLATYLKHKFIFEGSNCKPKNYNAAIENSILQFKSLFANAKIILRIPIICQLFCKNHVPGYETLSCNRKNKQSRSGNKLKIELLDAANSSKQFI